MALFSEFGVAEVCYIVGVFLVGCVLLVCFVFLLRRWRRRRADQVVDIAGVCFLYRGQVYTMSVEGLKNGRDLAERINNILQLNSTCDDLVITKNSDLPFDHSSRRELLLTDMLYEYLNIADALRTQEIPLAVTRKHFDVAGAFPWLYPLVFPDVGGLPSEGVCFGIAVNKRVVKAAEGSPHEQVGVIRECSALGKVFVEWEGGGGGSWESWGYQGQFTVMPADHRAVPDAPPVVVVKEQMWSARHDVRYAHGGSPFYTARSLGGPLSLSRCPSAAQAGVPRPVFDVFSKEPSSEHESDALTSSSLGTSSPTPDHPAGKKTGVRRMPSSHQTTSPPASSSDFTSATESRSTTSVSNAPTTPQLAGRGPRERIKKASKPQKQPDEDSSTAQGSRSSSS